MVDLMIRRKRFLVYAVIAVVCVLVGRILIGIDDWSRDWKTNHAKVGPVALERLPSELTDQICLWVDEQPRWKLESADRTSVTEHSLKLTRKTLIMNFTDDIAVKISADKNGGSVLAASSQSRIGKGDLGQNPRNLKELLSAIK